MMTPSERNVMKQALDTLEKCSAQLTRLGYSANHADVVIPTLRTALAEPSEPAIDQPAFLYATPPKTGICAEPAPSVEPVAWRFELKAGEYAFCEQKHAYANRASLTEANHAIPLYRTPPDAAARIDLLERENKYRYEHINKLEDDYSRVKSNLRAGADRFAKLEELLASCRAELHRSFVREENAKAELERRDERKFKRRASGQIAWDHLREKLATLTKERDHWRSMSLDVYSTQVTPLTTKLDLVIGALEYHQEQTRPIERTIDVLKQVKSEETK